MPHPDHRPRGFRPNPKRQFLYAGVVMAVVLAGFGVWALMRKGGDHSAPPPAADGAKTPDKAKAEKAKAHAWYKDQSPPPALVTTPDQPIMEEPGKTKANDAPPVAYEEALPKDIYVAPRHKAQKAASNPAAPSSTATAPTATPPAPPTGTGEAQPSPPTAPPVEMAWLRHAVPARLTPGKPVIAIVIDDMGVDQRRSREILDLPPPLTVSFLTYARDLPHQEAIAKAAGQELLVHVAMEPISKKVDPGPDVLLTTQTDAEIRQRLISGIDRVPDAIGINNHMGSKFTADAHGMTVVLDVLKKRGLMFLDSRTSPKSVGWETARKLGVPTLERNVFLDNVNDRAAVLKRLAETVRIAQHYGHAIAIGHPRDGTIEALRAWLPTVAEKGIELVPLSAVLREEVARKRS